MLFQTLFLLNMDTSVGDTTVNDLIGRYLIKKVNPDDKASAKYLKAFIGNLFSI